MFEKEYVVWKDLWQGEEECQGCGKKTGHHLYTIRCLTKIKGKTLWTPFLGCFNDSGNHQPDDRYENEGCFSTALGIWFFAAGMDPVFYPGSGVP